MPELFFNNPAATCDSNGNGAGSAWREIPMPVPMPAQTITAITIIFMRWLRRCFGFFETADDFLGEMACLLVDCLSKNTQLLLRSQIDIC
jgi:hypothetical protein